MSATNAKNAINAAMEVVEMTTISPASPTLFFSELLLAKNLSSPEFMGCKRAAMQRRQNLPLPCPVFF
ncbi:hypothetical protein BH11PSE12_BH11PSE12_28290 [soil metagenome]